MPYLVQWRGHTSADNEWLRAKDLLHCQEKVAEYDATASRCSAAPRGPRPEPVEPPVVAPAPAPAAAPLGPPTDFRLAAPSEVLAGSALVGHEVLYS
jgi:hypothetical protein